MNRVYNFSAGPSMLPLPVLEQAQKELICYGDSGMSVMEMSHRSPVYEEIIKDAEAKLRTVMSIPDNYKVLFLQGGASTQFAAVPLNLLNKNKKADYILGKLGQIHVRGVLIQYGTPRIFLPIHIRPHVFRCRTVRIRRYLLSHHTYGGSGQQTRNDLGKHGYLYVFFTCVSHVFHSIILPSYYLFSVCATETAQSLKLTVMCTLYHTPQEEATHNIFHSVSFCSQ